MTHNRDAITIHNFCLMVYCIKRNNAENVQGVQEITQQFNMRATFRNEKWEDGKVVLL
jgi:radical SAM superfamily enzyme